MNQKQFDYINDIYNIEDNIEKMKKYFHANGFTNEYRMVLEIQESFRCGISAKMMALDKIPFN